MGIRDTLLPPTTHSALLRISSTLNILYRDENYIAVDKSAGMLVHRSLITEEEEVFLLQNLRDQIGQWVYPIHRLDHPIFGVILVALSRARVAARQMCRMFV